MRQIWLAFLLCFPLPFHVLAQSDSDSVLVEQIVISGNQTTHPSVILREMIFQEGDKVPADQLDQLVQESKENLQRIALFNFVHIRHAKVEALQQVIVIVDVTERWYTWPSPIFELQENNFNKWIRDRNWRRTNFGASLTQKNFRGRRESFSVNLQFGYLKDFGFTYTKPFFPKMKNLGIGIGYSYKQRDEVRIRNVESDRIFLGLEEPVYTSSQFKINLQYRPKTKSQHLLEVRWSTVHVQDTVLKERPDYLPAKTNTTAFPQFYYLFSFDNRNNNYFPTSGHFFRGIAGQFGIDRKDVFYQYIQLYATNFFRLSERFSYAIRNRWVKNFGDNVPYFSITGYGYDYFARGFELYHFDSPQGYIIQRNSVNWNWLVSRTGKLPWIKSEKFSKFHYSSFLTLFSDWTYGFDKDNINPLNNQLHQSIGIGLNFVTYYDKVVRFEYSRNSFGDFNLFLHFKKAI